MKHLFLSLIALLLTLNLQAASLKPVTVLLMDSANSLISDAEVSAEGSALCTTSWDGRALILVSSELPIQVVAPYRDTLRTVLTPDQAGRTVILRMSDRRYTNGEEELETAIGYGTHRRTTRSESGSREMVLMSKMAVMDDAMPMPSVKKNSSAAIRGVSSVKNGAVDAPTPAVVEEEEAVVEEVVALGYGSVSKGSYVGIAPAPLPSAGKLTAGEVNDFAKWALWSGVLDQSHKPFIKDWQMEARERYVLQLTNKQGFPLADRPVSLIDKQGNTIFQARTDNTGKAELWNGLFGQPAKGKLYLSAEGLRTEARPFAKGFNTLQVDEACGAPEVADVFFIFDATGSMGDELRYLQAEMQDVVRRSQSAVEGLHIRTGALVYRDHSDDYLTRISRLSDDILATQDFITKQQAMGGGDYEEAIPEAMMAACNAAGWSDEARARIAFLVLDAPCHQDSTTLRLLHEQTLNAAAQGIRIVPVVCSGLRESGELLMRTLALATNGTSFFLTDDSGIGDTHLKPTTDSLKVEHLNDMLVRTIISFTRMPECNVEEWAEEALAEDETDRFLPNPFRTEDLDTVPTLLPERKLSDVLIVRPNPCTDFCLVDIPLGCDALFLADMTGKTIASLGAQAESTASFNLPVSQLASGVYFVKAFYGGRWYTQKLIVR